MSDDEEYSDQSLNRRLVCVVSRSSNEWGQLKQAAICTGDILHRTLFVYLYNN